LGDENMEFQENEEEKVSTYVPKYTLSKTMKPYEEVEGKTT
jgi:hypothetical protein